MVQRQLHHVVNEDYGHYTRRMARQRRDAIRTGIPLGILVIGLFSFMAAGMAKNSLPGKVLLYNSVGVICVAIAGYLFYNFYFGRRNRRK